MSERRSKRESVKKQPPIKPSFTKGKILFPNKQENQITTVSKNLMREFNQVERQPQKSVERQNIEQAEMHSQSLSQSSAYLSDASNIDKFEAADMLPTGLKQTRAEMPEYAELQLPKSYILAMRGLQEAVDQREKENRKIKRMLNDQTNRLQNSARDLEAEIQAKSALESKLNQCILQNKFYRETIGDMKIQAAQQLRIKIDIENQLKLAQESAARQIVEIEALKKEIEAGKADKAAVKDELQRVMKNIQEKKNDYNELLLKRSEQFSQNYTEVIALRQELAKLKQQHEKDVAELDVLRQQIAILGDKLQFQEARFKEKVLLDEKMQLDKLERQMQANRQILQEVTFDQNRLRQVFSSPTSKPNIPVSTPPPAPLNSDPKPPAPAPTPIKQLKQPQQARQQSRGLERSSRQERSSTMRQERSTSRLRSINDSEHPERRELVGQMRELMRHEKELISLNYQMEVLERGMLEGPSSRREEAQRTYAKLRRNIEKKQADVRELKGFIDRATTNPLK